MKNKWYSIQLDQYLSQKALANKLNVLLCKLTFHCIITELGLVFKKHIKRVNENQLQIASDVPLLYAFLLFLYVQMLIKKSWIPFIN